MKIMVVTERRENTTETERALRSIYLQGESKPSCIVFVHGDDSPKDIAEKAKDKKVVNIIFEEGVPSQRVVVVKNAVDLKMSQQKPSYLHISSQKTLEGIHYFSDHESVKTKLGFTRN